MGTPPPRVGIGPTFNPGFCSPGLLPSETCSIQNQACRVHDDSIIDAIGGVDLGECKASCSDTIDCWFITYFGPASFPLYNYCILFNDCHNQNYCSNCITEVGLCFGTCSNSIEGRLGVFKKNPPRKFTKVFLAVLSNINMY